MKQHREFQSIYKRGKSSHSNSVVLFFLPQNGIHKIGFTATKKIGNAVKRNRAKRRLRALFCEYSTLLIDGTYIFVAKQLTYEAPYEQLKKDFEIVLHKAKAIND
ncbi:ribonuclease P protein component [bacterium]|nr:ribonuclease P protein component [bacterium]MBU1994393.1 ribonuclease P protein component [bacterium]